VYLSKFLKTHMFIAFLIKFPYLFRERVREKDVPVSERVFIVEPDIPSQYVSQAHSHYPQRDLQTHFASQRALTVA